MTTLSKLGQAAVEYAEDQIAIFPCMPGRKEPAVTWKRDATTDVDKIVKWWTMWPEANIGMPTGNTGHSGRRIEVLDIDVKPSNDGRWTLEKPLITDQFKHSFARVITPSGGYHYYFRSASQPSGKLLGVDFKATGGYVLVPPSKVVVAGDRSLSGDYFFANLRAATREDQPFDWESVRQAYGPESTPGNQKLGNRQYPMELLAKWMSQEPSGRRNHELFKKSCIALESGYRDLTPLFTAALEAGLEPEEITATINSAARTYGISPLIRSRNGFGQ